MITDSNSLAAFLKKQPGRVLGIDYGDKYIGLALCDPNRTVATPLQTLKREKLKTDLKALQEIHRKNPFIATVIGLPLNMNGTEGPKAQAARQFALYYTQWLQVPTCFWDERLSTHAAHHPLSSAGITQSKRKKVVDQLAAQWILQGFLDFLRFSSLKSSE